MADIVKLPVTATPPDADELGRADTERWEQIFAWADALLQALGLTATIAAATSIEELWKVALDMDATEIVRAIHAALHPASGQRKNHFRNLKENQLKRILQNRLTEAKKDREAALRRGRRSGPDWTTKLVLDKNGNVIGNLTNLILTLRESPRWKGVLAFDEFCVHVVLRKHPPWGEEAADAPWTDHHETLACAWFQTQGIKAVIGTVGRAVQAAARHNKFHPVRDYLEAVRRDGQSRTDTWLITYFGAPDTDYVRAIGPRWLISGAARIYDPGCQADHTIIIEGPQGKLKSSSLRTLALRDEWLIDGLSHLASKDAKMEVAGVLIVELAELEVLNRAAIGTSKSFLTRRSDRFRPPYGRHLVNVPRGSIFAGTINPPLNGRYLKDRTGARRYWPFLASRIDLDALQRDRDQLWAEAVQRYRNGEPWWLETSELEALAAVEQAARTVLADPWEPMVREWLKDRTGVSIWDVLAGALGISRETATGAEQKRVANILMALGFVPYRATEGGKRPHRYRRGAGP
jgi:predicted P-loop ATPase